MDKASGRSYYYNKKTRETSWNKPEKFLPAKKKTDDASATAASSTTTASTTTATTAVAATPVVTPVVATPATTVPESLPTLIKSPSASSGIDENDLPENWVESTDSSTGQKYYYNRKTKETSWTRPTRKVPSPTPTPAAATTTTTAAAATTTTTTPATTAAKPTETSTATTTVDSNKADDASGTSATKARRQRTGTISADGQWEEVIDPASGKKYWFNRVTKATAWKLPSSANVPKEDKPDTSAAVTTTTTTAPAPVATTNITVTTPVVPPMPAVVPPMPSMPAVPAVPAMPAIPVDPSPVENKPLVRAETVRVAPTSTYTPPPLLASASAASLRSLDSSSTGLGGSTSNLLRDDLEKPADRIMKLKMALNEREQEDTKQREDEEEENYEEQFKFAKHRKGWFNRTFHTGKVNDEGTLLSFKKSLIKKALLKKNRDLDQECVQAFKNIMSYMGDRNSSKPPMLHARKLIWNALQHPAQMRDEVYLQICKQTNSNPSLPSNIKGWELMLFCLSCFPPSRHLKKFLLSYFESTLGSDETDEKVKFLVRDCTERIEKIIVLGQRKQVPSITELECLKEAKPIPIRIALVNGTHKTISVDSYTMAKEVEDIIISKLGLILASPFGLYQSDSGNINIEMVLDPKDRVMDIMSAWDDNDDYQNKEKEKGKEKPAPVVTGEPVIKYNQFLYKAKLVLKTHDPDVMADPEAINLLYLQAIHAIITTRYPAKEKDITVLAALQLQATFGDYQSDAHIPGWLVPKLQEYMPEQLLKDKKGKASEPIATEWEQKILEKYSKISGFTSLEAKLNYLDYVQEWPFYGATFFSVEQRQFKDYPSPITLGITCEGVILMHPQKKTLLENYPYTDIVTWGHSDERFIVVVGNIVQQRKLIFKTRQGKVMNNLIHDYVKFKVKNKVAPSS